VSELEIALGGAGSGSGAVVVSGASEAGGGRETSVWDAGSGASLFAAPGFAGSVLAVRVSRLFPFFLAASPALKAG
jgi:hypothetical protein